MGKSIIFHYKYTIKLIAAFFVYTKNVQFYFSKMLICSILGLIDIFSKVGIIFPESMTITKSLFSNDIFPQLFFSQDLSLKPVFIEFKNI